MKSIIKNLFNFFRRHILNKYFISAIILTTILLFIFEQSLTITSTNEFCAKCHTMDQFVKSWKESMHYKNDAGVVTNCIQCHVPHKKGLFDPKYIYYKTYFGVKDVYVEFAKDTSKIDWEKKLETPEKYVFDDACISCHQDLMSPLMTEEARFSHEISLTEKDEKLTCVSCHIKFVHFKSEE